MEPRKYKQINVRVHTRKLDRKVARNRMEWSGRTGITENKRNRYGTKKHPTHGGMVKNDHESYFSQHWREWIA